MDVLCYTNAMLNIISFGKFFDSQNDHDLITGFELVESKELNLPGGDMAYLLKNSLTGDNYVIVDTSFGTDWGVVDNWVQKILQNNVELEEIPPKNPETYADSCYLFRVVFKNK